MPVVSTDIRFCASGQNNLGGAIQTSFEVPDGQLHALFDPVSAAQALAGYEDYRCIYVRNASVDSTLTNPAVYVEIEPSAVGSSIQLGVGSSAVNGTEPEISVDTDVPSGVVFQVADDPTNGIDLGNLNSNEYRAIWMKRIILAGTTAIANDSFKITIVGETA